MNRGSSRETLVEVLVVESFNEAPIHESGKSARLMYNTADQLKLQ